MNNKILFKKIIYFPVLIFIFSTGISIADYPQTSLGVIDLNFILVEAKAAKNAAEQIEAIAIEIEAEIKANDQSLIDEQNKLIESQSIMAPDAFDEKRKEYEKKVQNYNITRQEKLISIDKLVSDSRNNVLSALKPILDDISNEKGITVLLEKNSVLLNDESMDITNEALKRLNKELPSIEIKLN